MDLEPAQTKPSIAQQGRDPRDLYIGLQLFHFKLGIFRFFTQFYFRLGYDLRIGVHLPEYLSVITSRCGRRYFPVACRVRAPWPKSTCGRIRQKIYNDHYGMGAWDISVYSRCFVHLLNSEPYQGVTGRTPPPSPVTPKAYAAARISWFDYYGEGEALPGSGVLAKLSGLATALSKRGKALAHNAPIRISDTVASGFARHVVRDGTY